MAAFVGRIARAMVARAEAGDMETLSALAEMRRHLDEAITDAARELHAGPYAYTWTEIGRELGITRQAARQRFGDNRELSGFAIGAADRTDD